MNFIGDSPIAPANHAGPSTYHIEGVPVDDLLDALRRHLEPEAGRRRVRLDFELIAWGWLVAAADRRALHTILEALALDAIAHSGGGTVYVRAYPSQDDICATIEIRDTRPIQWDRVSLHDAEARLSTCRSAVERLGGEMRAFPARSGGLCIRISVPQWITAPRDAFGPALCLA